MSDLAIRVENLGKAYRIAHQIATGRYKTLQEDILNLVRRPFRLGRGTQQSEQFWALKGLSFELKEGQVLGIIGRNGAGKSTLLKILSRITRPTIGMAAVHGRIGSLLEVGTGFHPELTGRENIYLSGAILGMSRAEIRRRFDEIVAFAEIAKFLDTPAKRYSSGMYMRLGFSVAAHLEPEILVVDEVLAVGDAEFQKKCLGKMGDVAKSGRTVLFVSHNMSAIQNLCSTAMWLEKGAINLIGPTADVIEQYLAAQLNVSTKYADLRHQPGRTNGAMPILTDVWLHDEMDGLPYDGKNKPLEVVIQIDPKQPLMIPAIGFSVEDIQGQRIFSVTNYFAGQTLPPITGKAQIKCTLPPLPLWHGTYYLNIAAGVVNDPLLDYIYRAISFTVHSTSDETDSRITPTQHGALRVAGEWVVTHESC